MTDDPEVTDPRAPHRRRDVDVVAELDRWLDNSNDRTTAIERRVVLRARHEIVELRELHEEREATAKSTLNDLAELKRVVEQMPAMIRNETLEKAALVCDDMARSNAAYTWPAAAIRALKERP